MNRVRRLFQHEEPAALRLVESVENFARQGLIPNELARSVRQQYEDAQVPQPGDESPPWYSRKR